MHQIAMSACSAGPLAANPVALFAAYVDSNGNVWAFQQATDGVWSGPQQLTNTGEGPATAPVVSLVGLPNYLIALGQDRQLYGAWFQQQGGSPQLTDWSPFFPLQPTLIEAALETDLSNPPVGFDDFGAAVAQIEGFVFLVIVGSQDANGVSPTGIPTDAGFYSFFLNLSNANGDLHNAFASRSGAWTSISQSSQGGVTNAVAPAVAAINEGVALLGGDGPNALGWFSSDLNGWQESISLPPDIFGPALNSITLIAGNPNGTLQGIIPLAGAMALYYDSNGQGYGFWDLYGNLVPNGLVNTPQITTTAAGIGNSGNLQVVGLGPAIDLIPLPYLVWQDTGGTWHPYLYDAAGGQFGNLPNDFLAMDVHPVDLAIGMGWGNGGQNFLQLVYLGSDGNLYLSYQDEDGNWSWYPGLNGKGLP